MISIRERVGYDGEEGKNPEENLLI